MKKFFADFKKFISRGNIVDMAIGVIVGSAFSAIVTAFTNKVVMPFINLLLSLGGENGLDGAYTYLKKVYTNGALNNDKSIFIDWGAFITAIINFLIIALTLFIILKVAMKSSELLRNAQEKALKSKPTAEEKKVLAERGVNKKDKEAYKTALLAYRAEVEEKKALEEANKPKPESDNELLKEIRDLLKSNAEKSE